MDKFQGNFRNKCIKIYELDPANSLSVPRLAWETALKKTLTKKTRQIYVDSMSILR